MPLIASLESGVSALKGFTQGIDVIGNNIANVNTPGYKASRVEYSESFAQTLQRSTAAQTGDEGSNTPTSQIGGGVRVANISSMFTQGALSETSVPTDMAIYGEGFFVVRDSVNDTQYATRAGNFRADDRGYLVTSEGYRIQGLSDGVLSYDVTEVDGKMVFTPTLTDPTGEGDISFDFDISVGSGITNNTGGAFTDAEVEAATPQLEAFEIDNFGYVRFILSNGDAFNRGQILLTNFNDPQALVRTGNGLYSNFDAAGQINPGKLDAENNYPGKGMLGRIESGKLELSNVELTEEFANIISMQRSFQAGARLVTTSDDILQEIVNLKR